MRLEREKEKRKLIGFFIEASVPFGDDFLEITKNPRGKTN
jgi:hypothetical protein